jgi:hypothetical protein
LLLLVSSKVGVRSKYSQVLYFFETIHENHQFPP